ncbi:hypothetical protein KUTeg_016885 [Tegillarca granosa]|uniref:Uncharacterized protein n=1 Tax=Tegillarca granosa TaxID=220873 RepID=A0ABQ9ES04_TEGGR|nr:hypothetical protein KUTeg_016885 [Tegillarca granosa]
MTFEKLGSEKDQLIEVNGRIILLYRNRTIILSTHHMDEADMLGDRIAIIAHGKLRCCGSSLFLKSHFGNGYYLTLVKDSKLDEDKPEGTRQYDLVNTSYMISENDNAGFINEYKIQKSARSPLSCHDNSKKGPDSVDDKSSLPFECEFMDKIAVFIQKYVPNSKLVEDNNAELTFQLSTQSGHNGDIVNLFKELEKCHKELGISSFGISDTRLEEFI